MSGRVGVLHRFPADLRSGRGTSVRSNGGALSVDLDASKLPVASASPTGGLISVYDPATGATSALPAALLGGSGGASTVDNLIGAGTVGKAIAKASDASTVRSTLLLGTAALLNVGTGSENVVAGNDQRLPSGPVGPAAYLGVGTSAGTVAAGNDARIAGALQAVQNGADIANKPAFRSALGLGSAALLGVGTGAGTVAAGNDSRFPTQALGSAAYAAIGTAAGNVAAGNDSRFPTQALGAAAYAAIGTAAGTVAAGNDTRIAAIASKLDAAGSAALLTTSSPAIASPALRTIPATIFVRHDLRDYNGLDLAGNNDCASVVRTAFNASTNDGTLDKLWVPPGQIVLGSTIDISAGVEIQGNGPVFSRIQPGQAHRGTNFLLAHTGVGFQSMGQYRTGEISNISTSRQQPDFANAASGTAFTPIDAQWDFLLSSRTTLRRVHCLNPTRMIAIQSASYGQGNLFEITGEPLLEGIFIQNANDMIFANAWNLWPWWSLDAPAERRDQVWKWKHNNACAIRLGRVDAAQWANIFVIGYRNGMILQNYVDPGSGSAARANDGHFSGNITNLALDASVYPFTCSADGVIANLGMGVNGGLLSAASGTTLAQDTGCIINGTGNFFSFEQFTGAHAQKGHLVVRGSNNIVKFPDGAHIGYWNESGSGLPGIYREGSGNTITFGNSATYFGPTPTGTVLGAGIQVPSWTTTTG